jgi:UDP-glucose 4-epimerase
MILVTGGTGYIGSHTVVELMQRGEHVLVLDNLCNSSPLVLSRIEAICGQRPVFVQGDVRDEAALAKVFAEHEIKAVVHFAGLKAVGESAQVPLHYYDNNVVGTLRLLEAMEARGVRTLVFSSSATVYGEPQFLPYTEAHPLAAMNVYGRTKLQVEDMLRDLHASKPAWRVALLRYFNPVGAHPSGRMGEDPQGVPNNLMPFVAQVAVGRRQHLSVFGNDYATPDGTGVRDYIHVQDLALGHVRALEMLAAAPLGQCTPINLGTGVGYSVLDMVKAFEAASGKAIPYVVQPRRTGDLAAYWADPATAKALLGWQATKTLQDMCADTWRWQSLNPLGYAGGEPA